LGARLGGNDGRALGRLELKPRERRMGGGPIWGGGWCQVEEQGAAQRQVGRRLGRDRRTRGPTRRNNSLFNLMKLVSNRIDLIEIKDGLPEI
jgi:hypothetical protein